MNYRFSGHETFACRYAWLPKAARAVENDASILTLSREDDAMVELGVGKNMVRSIRFWAEASDIISSLKNGHELTPFGRELFLSNSGLDPYLEDIQTLWLLHWKLSTNKRDPIFAWDFLMNKFHEPELFASSVIKALSKAPEVIEKNVSTGSLEQLFEIFLHSYVPTRGRKGEVREDNLDCPLVELDLLRHTGLTRSASDLGRVESKYAFRRDDKPEIGHLLFAYCLEEYWQNTTSRSGASEQSIAFHSVVTGQGSPGQIFKITEPDVRNRLLGISRHTDGFFTFEESGAIPRVVRDASIARPSLAMIYGAELSHA
jgi:hypothetical protein